MFAPSSFPNPLDLIAPAGIFWIAQTPLDEVIAGDASGLTCAG
jgi:hypothetical protein